MLSIFETKCFSRRSFRGCDENRFHRWRKNLDSLAQTFITLFAHGQVIDADNAAFTREALWRLAR